ncbi:MAG TPA: TlpA disulfide reductase family protein [Nitrospirota bacterium]|nr:TlpA disulfide reductase family protein [Nitrospirota bacterium]
MLKKTVAVCILSLALLAGCTRTSSRDQSVAADFTLQDLNGRMVKLSDYKGRVILLDFWATWCPPCVASVPGIEKLHKTYQDRGLVVLAVSMDDGGWDSVKSFIAQNGVSYTVLKGTEAVSTDYQVRTIPLMIIVGKDGRIAKRYLGYGNDEDMEREIKAIL